MVIFVIGSAFPFKTHDCPGVTAINIVTWELIESLLQRNHQVVFQGIFASQYAIPQEQIDQGQKELKALEAQGCKVLESVFLPAPPQPTFGSRLYRMLFGSRKLSDFYPSIVVRDQVCERVHQEHADAVLTIWSPEGVAATHGLDGVCRMSYQGDVEFKPNEVRWHYRDTIFSSGVPTTRNPLRRLWQNVRFARSQKQFAKAHLELIQGLDIVASVTASNAAFYSQMGHKNSVYIGNTWSDFETPLSLPPKREGKAKIVGHAGNLGATGGLLGLHFLLKDVVPELNRVMDMPFELHIIGGGEIPHSIRPYIDQENVVMRGYVEDLDVDLLDCDVYLLLNNVGLYNSAFTRHIIAWAMGLCLIAHERSLDALPELRPMENALVGKDAKEIAAQIHRAITSPELNAQLRQNGRKTYEERFCPTKIAERIEHLLDKQKNNG